MLPIAKLIIALTGFAATAYAMGSLPFSLWIGKGFFRTDVRDHGSRNPGATNTWRVLGWKAGLPVLLLDVAKGLGATCLPLIQPSLVSDPGLLLWVRILCGASAALGHIFPVFAGFRGGKAVATLLGVIIGLTPLAAAFSLGVFILLFAAGRIVSLGSIMAGISLPLTVYFATDHPFPLMIFSILISLLVLATHRKNIVRLLRGEEPRFRPGGGRKPD